MGAPAPHSRARWDDRDLERRLCAALDIAQQSVERLAAHGHTNAGEPARSLRPEKLIGETAILLYAASAHAGQAEISARIGSIARLLVSHARSARILLGICLEPSLALDYAEAHICLGRLGYRDEAFDELLCQSLNSQAGSGRERVPHRTLEQHWIGRIWAETSSASCQPARSIAPETVLNRPLDVLSNSADEAYAFTHALMYVRDFNIRPRRLPRARAAILAEAEAALARYLDEENYDLAGELLMAWPLTGGSWSAGAAFGFRVLAQVEDKNGFLPGPGAPSQRPDQHADAARIDSFFAAAYHTAYVMGLLCAAALHPGLSPPLRLAARTSPDRRAADRILRFLDGDGHVSAWRHEADRLPPAEREALAGFFLQIALCRKIRRREFAAVHELLRIGYALNLADAPASSQAAELLERLATFEKIKSKSMVQQPV